MVSSASPQRQAPAEGWGASVEAARSTPAGREILLCTLHGVLQACHKGPGPAPLPAPDVRSPLPPVHDLLDPTDGERGRVRHTPAADPGAAEVPDEPVTAHREVRNLSGEGFAPCRDLDELIPTCLGGVARGLLTRRSEAEHDCFQELGALSLRERAEWPPSLDPDGVEHPHRTIRPPSALSDEHILEGHRLKARRRMLDHFTQVHFARGDASPEARACRLRCIRTSESFEMLWLTSLTARHGSARYVPGGQPSSR